MKYLYLLLNIGLVLFPLVFSFNQKIRFYTKWKYLLSAMLITAVFFLAGDFLFVEWGIWRFNDAFITGIKLFGLPLEEIVFFFCLPYTCLFIYEILIIYNVKNYLQRARLITWLIIAGLGIALYFNHMYLYSGITLLLSTAYLFQMVVIHRVQWLGRFYAGYAAALIPFLIISWALTGLPIIIYNEAEIMGIRIITIPIENLLYLFFMMLLTTALYERFQGRFKCIKTDNEEDEEVVEEAGEQSPDIQK
jgi:lycopene cyclase domain-containing protein